jgi:dTMP kinase
VSTASAPAGRWIAFEGGDGCGKSTQASLLARSLGAVLTLEPGGTAIGRLIRGVLLDPAHDAMDARAEALLYAGDRAQHVVEVVEPALAAGTHVVADRSAFSSLAYQAFGRGMPLDEVRAVNHWATGGRWPDLVVLLDADPLVLAHRLGAELDRIEQADPGFHQRVRDGYLTLATDAPGSWVVLDADQPVDALAADVEAAVRARLVR